MQASEYTCRSAHPRLTVGATYPSLLPYSNPLNVYVKNDLGEPEYIPKYPYFLEDSE